MVICHGFQKPGKQGRQALAIGNTVQNLRDKLQSDHRDTNVIGHRILISDRRGGQLHQRNQASVRCHFRTEGHEILGDKNGRVRRDAESSPKIPGSGIRRYSSQPILRTTGRIGWHQDIY